MTDSNAAWVAFGGDFEELSEADIALAPAAIGPLPRQPMNSPKDVKPSTRHKPLPHHRLPEVDRAGHRRGFRSHLRCHRHKRRRQGPAASSQPRRQSQSRAVAPSVSPCPLSNAVHFIPFIPALPRILNTVTIGGQSRHGDVRSGRPTGSGQKSFTTAIGRRSVSRWFPEKLREKSTAGREMECSQASLLRLMSYNRVDAHVELGAKLGRIERA